MTATTILSIPSLNAQNLVFPSDDLYSNEPEMESFPHLMQMLLLISCLQLQWRDRQNYFAGGNLTIYFSPRQKKSELFRGPDFFVVLDCDPNPQRKSWVVWQEGGKYPNFIVEILSSSTADTDRGEKKQIYQDIFRTPDYFLFDPYATVLEGYHLVEGKYMPITTNDQGKMWSEQLQLFLGIYQEQLRFFTVDQELVPTPQELADAHLELADAYLELANLEHQKRINLTEKLRSLSAEQLQAIKIKPEDLI